VAINPRTPGSGTAETLVNVRACEKLVDPGIGGLVGSNPSSILRICEKSTPVKSANGISYAVLAAQAFGLIVKLPPTSTILMKVLKTVPVSTVGPVTIRRALLPPAVRSTLPADLDQRKAPLTPLDCPLPAPLFATDKVPTPAVLLVVAVLEPRVIFWEAFTPWERSSNPPKEPVLVSKALTVTAVDGPVLAEPSSVVKSSIRIGVAFAGVAAGTTTTAIAARAEIQSLTWECMKRLSKRKREERERTANVR
jgi:hypothetical protein